MTFFLLKPLLALLKLVKLSIRLLPAEVRYFLTLIAFWPTVVMNRLYCWLWPHKRQLWNRVSEHAILGSAPFLHREVAHLYHKEGVRRVVNCCREWNPHAAGLYPAMGIQQLWVPTIDFDAPRLQDLVAAAAFIAAGAAAEECVYVHCKAGRGRSTCVVLAYFILYRGMSAREADAAVRAAGRTHISKKWHLPVMRELEAMAAANNSGVSGKHALKAV